MPKKPAAQPQDKYVVRLPDGLRDRIKAFAERNGYSMNSTIVQVLELYFPAPFTFEERMARLADLAHGLKELPSTPGVDKLIDQLRDTFEGIAAGHSDADVDEEAKKRLLDHLVVWNLEEAEARDRTREDQ